MGFDLSSLTAYVEQNKNGLIKKSVLGANSLEYLKIMPGIKSSETVNILGSTIVAQPGDCTFSEDGGASITQVLLEVSDIKFNESYCLKDLEAYFTQKMLAPGNPENMGEIEPTFIEAKMADIATYVDKAIWQENATTGLFDGLIAKLNAGAPIDGNPDAVAAVTSANIIDIVNGIADLQPELLIEKEGNRLYVSPALLRMYQLALVKADMYHVDATTQNAEQIFIPGTNIAVTGIKGLSGVQDMILSADENLMYATDLVGEAEALSLWWSQDDRVYKFVSEFKAGTGIVFIDEVVHYKNA